MSNQGPTTPAPQTPVPVEPPRQTAPGEDDSRRAPITLRDWASI
ncbi:hypothetical protein SAMN04490244_104148 [Tranquillimonas rosea]|uniref:Uncharacterized protein n=1 Tax=Tranquillimonas rosea TaxID=641238 RepID=A0A1H9TGU8_9RHOB|nr:hypothetical protein [Tranquillimonas rosea]SER95833.1 hypothetical protein SAMN04490244_104148 [Tranquillimonas rosea]